jgi:ribosomal protein S13
MRLPTCEQFRGSRVSAAVWPVAAQQTRATERLLIEQGLVTTVRWLAKTRAEENSWPGLEHVLELSVHGQTLRYSEKQNSDD